MPIYRISVPSLVSGRFSKRLNARSDLAQYRTSLQEAQNVVLFPHGGGTFRPGTGFVSEIKDSANYVRGVPFIVGTSEAYGMEFGPEYVRVYKDRAQLLDGGLPVDITVPFLADELKTLDYAQSGDILYVASGVRPIQEIRREALDTWTTQPFETLDGPYDPVNDNEDTKLTPSGTTGSITLTASQVDNINEGQGFLSTDVGRHVRLLIDGKWGWGKITAVTSTTVVDFDVERDLAAATATDLFRLGAWSDTTGWPEAVTFHQERLYAARGERIWGSTTGSYLNFSPTEEDNTVVASNAVDFTLGTGRADAVQWLNSVRTLEAGTVGSEVVLSGKDSTSAALSAEDARAEKSTEVGSIKAKPITSLNGTVFLNRTGRKLMNTYYSFQRDTNITDDLTLLSEGILLPGADEITYQAEPNTVIWCRRTDGTLASCTFEPKQEVIAWAEHTISGGEVETLFTIPAPDGGSDDVWMVVKRTIDGVIKRYWEYLTPGPIATTDIADMIYLDSSLVYNGSSTTTLTGLGHLEGETVSILADGSLHADKVVTGGEVALDRAVVKAVVGLPYTMQVDFQTPELGDISNTSLSQQIRIPEIGVSFYRTVLGQIGIAGQPLSLLGRRLTTDNLGEPLPPKTEYERVKVDSPWDYRPIIRVVQDKPLPCTILGVYPSIETEQPVRYRST